MSAGSYLSNAWLPGSLETRRRHFAIGRVGPAMCFTGFQTIIQLVGPGKMPFCFAFSH